MERPDRGRIYRCAVCGAEVMVMASDVGEFHPVCCNRTMERTDRRATFYRCNVCGSQLAVLKPGAGDFKPRCCDRDMVPEAA